MEQLKRLLTQIRARRHTAKATLSEESYRQILQRAAGVASSTEIRALGKARAVLAEFDRLHISLPAGGPRRGQFSPTQKKMWALWQTLAGQGKVQNRRLPGLLGWIAGQTDNHVQRLEWLTPAQEHTLIESLKQWVDR